MNRKDVRRFVKFDVIVRLNHAVANSDHFVKFAQSTLRFFMKLFDFNRFSFPKRSLCARDRAKNVPFCSESYKPSVVPSTSKH